MPLFSLKAGKSSLRGESIFSQGLVLFYDIKLGDYLSATLDFKVYFYSEWYKHFRRNSSFPGIEF